MKWVEMLNDIRTVWTLDLEGEFCVETIYMKELNGRENSCFVNTDMRLSCLAFICSPLVPLYHSFLKQFCFCSLLTRRFNGCILTWLVRCGMKSSAVQQDLVLLLWWNGF